MIAAHAAGVPVGSAARCGGSITAGNACSSKRRTARSRRTPPSSRCRARLLAEEKLLFTPALPEKAEAAAGLPLGLDDKLFLSLSDADEFEKDSRLFGRTDRTGTAAYHFRPFGRPQIEAYFGGRLAAELEAGGETAFFDFAVARAGRPARQRFRHAG